MSEIDNTVAKWLCEQWDDEAPYSAPQPGVDNPWTQGARLLHKALAADGFAIVPVETSIDQAIIARQHEWSQRTFGTHTDTEGNCKHIESEIAEARANPADVFEWVDIAMLAIDGALRNGHSPKAICTAYREKVEINIIRKWGEKIDGQPVEHVRLTAAKETK
jgi:hypothetical protein